MQIVPEPRKPRPLWHEVTLILGMAALLIGVLAMTGCATNEDPLTLDAATKRVLDAFPGPCVIDERYPHPADVDTDGEPVTLNVRCPQ